MNSFLQDNEWAQDPSFAHFWKHYDVSHQWLAQHIEATRHVYMQSRCSGVPSNENDSYGFEPEVTERLSRCEIRNEDEVEETEPVEEMSEEMKVFFAKTRNHRQELKEKRSIAEKKKQVEVKKGNKEEYVNVEQISVRGRIEQSDDQRDANAEFTAKRLKAQKDYGDAAAKILSMESTIEMNFECEFASNPQLWPNIPFRF